MANFLTKYFKRARNILPKRASGFTLVSSAVSLTVGSVVLLGGWVAFRDFQMQWRVANADRQMDQYAHSAMTDMVNLLSQTGGARQITGGNRMHRFRFVIFDQVFENSSNPFDQFRVRTDRYYLTAGRHGGFFEITARPNSGITIENDEPFWASYRNQSQYVWRGQNPRDDELAAFDRRDRMTVENLTFDWPLREETNEYDYSVAGQLSPFSVIRVTLTMQYRYDATFGVSLFTDEYVRERTYTTSIFMRNWDIENNQFLTDVAVGRMTFF